MNNIKRMGERFKNYMRNPKLKKQNRIWQIIRFILKWQNFKDILLLTFLIISLIVILERSGIFASRKIVIINNTTAYDLKPESVSVVSEQSPATDSVIRERADDREAQDSIDNGLASFPQSAKYIPIIKRHFGDEWKVAYAVMLAESSAEEWRIGDTGFIKPSVGLFQINQYWHKYPTKDLQNPEFNCKIAKEIRDAGGWERWTTYRTGQYKQYLQ